ncbi:MAG: hypothetical protein JWM82_599 [Myxococcales bacterium]|nr:hypothetical protein [Myxococcales bacterium]
MSERPRTFEAFWIFYLGEHARPLTRALHLVGSTAGLVCVVGAVAFRTPRLVLVGLAAGYALAWIGHFFVEHNRPATFRHPLWSFRADWKMWAYALTGRLGAELERAEIASPPRP